MLRHECRFLSSPNAVGPESQKLGVLWILCCKVGFNRIKVGGFESPLHLREILLRERQRHMKLDESLVVGCAVVSSERVVKNCFSHGFLSMKAAPAHSANSGEPRRRRKIGREQGTRKRGRKPFAVSTNGASKS